MKQQQNPETHQCPQDQRVTQKVSRKNQMVGLSGIIPQVQQYQCFASF